MIYRLFVAVIVGSALGAPVLVKQVAYAAPPKCYQRLQLDEMRVKAIGCETSAAVNKLFMEQNKCYIEDLAPDTRDLIFVERDCATMTQRAGANDDLLRQVGESEIEKDCEDDNLTADNCEILKYLRDFINVLSGLVGVIVVAVIIVGGIQYASAKDNPQAAAAARKRIFNAIFALVAYIFMYAFLQWVVPGGVF